MKIKCKYNSDPYVSAWQPWREGIQEGYILEFIPMGGDIKVVILKEGGELVQRDMDSVRVVE